MHKRILFPALSIVFLMMASLGFAQHYDLIVTTEGDSVACRIDSTTENRIYFEMKINSQWIHTQIDRSAVAHIEQNAIPKGQYLYEPGTSIIRAVSKGDIRRNSIYAGILSINYSRRFGKEGSITLGGGLIWLDAPGIVLESTILIGGTRHFLEPGINGFCLFDEGGIAVFYDEQMIGGSFRLGYRYQGPKGLLIRAAPQLTINSGGVALLPALSLGYSF
jgi:hypothetical protein